MNAGVRAHVCSDWRITVDRLTQVDWIDPAGVIAMSEFKQIRSSTLLLTLFAFVAALFFLLGRELASLTVIEVVIMAVGAAGLSVAVASYVVDLFARRNRAGAISCESDRPLEESARPDLQRLRTILDLMRRDEESLEQRYSQSRCALEELIRAKSLRLQAEIDLIRLERRPKTWAEACAEHQAAEH